MEKKRETYHPVTELTEDELDELKESIYWLNDRVQEDYSFSWEIPDELVYSFYAGVLFVDEDFSCNINREG